ncbi:UbiA prenyltransferase family protein [Patescibacteria group bacterium]
MLFFGHTFERAVRAFFVFCILSSGVYFFNDVVDADKDKLHPVKKNRAIASGKISKKAGLIISFLLVAASLVYSFNNVGSYFSYLLIFYVILQLFYSLWLRNVIILDSIVVATGFVIRVFAGGFASHTSVSSWLALTTIGVSLLMAFGKRRSEKTILERYQKKNAETRKTLKHYPDNLLDSMISMSAAYSIISYSFFTFMTSSEIVGKRISSVLPSVLKSPKLMMLTIPIVIYGVARYLYIIYEKGEGESPARVLLSDLPILFSVLIWVAVTMGIIYLIPLLG